MNATVDPFDCLDGSGRAKLVLPGPIDSRTQEGILQARSLQIEHVSPDRLARRGISRPRGTADGQEGSTLALMRRWFFARKPDAGFLLTGFPATLLQAKVFDEWLEARGETIDAVFDTGACGAVAEHYRTHGLLREAAVR